MRSPWLRMLVLVWVAAWFGVVLPGHERGSVKLPGRGGSSTPSADGVRSASEPACPLCIGAEEDDQGTPILPDSCCAICQFMATVSAPPVFAFAPPDTYLVDLLDAPEAEGLRETRDPAPTRSRGPPAA